MTNCTWDNATDDAFDMAVDKICGGSVKVEGAGDEQDTVNMKSVSVV